MDNKVKTANRLKNETSPYLLQHANNPVDWYPWCDEAFEAAKQQNKPVFLSIGYSTCHWCHVMAHESFEDPQVAALLNEYFIAIKVDKEERPDIDSIYMSVCQVFTGQGGWPTSIFMTPDQKPFFAGTYFPKTQRHGALGFIELLTALHEQWQTNTDALLQSAEKVISHLRQTPAADAEMDPSLIGSAVAQLKSSFDKVCGGFGHAPKFPTPHNLLFLMQQFEKHADKAALEMAELTLQQMYRGGMFDHIGYGFSRYSTDRFFLVPHFEKMLYDNALLILSYCKAYDITQNPFYRDVAQKTAHYILREMTAPEGGFYSAQDADSDGIEGKYYVFEPQEITALLGEETGSAFQAYYDISAQGNFEGKSIPNLLENVSPDGKFDAYLPTIYEYRKKRNALHLDDKILTAWNALMIAALSTLYRISGDEVYLHAAQTAQQFIEKSLCTGDTLSVSYRQGQQRGKGFLDDYAFYVFALLALYEATYKADYLEKAKHFCHCAVSAFYDETSGGFFLYGKGNEQLILQPKEIYDGAIPSGNSVMAYNLVRLSYLTKDDTFAHLAQQQLTYFSSAVAQYPSAHCAFLIALSEYTDGPELVTVVLKDPHDAANLACHIKLSAAVTVLAHPTQDYPLLNDQTTFYVCNHNTCLPPVNKLSGEIGR